MKNNALESMEHSREVLINLALYLAEGTAPNYNKQDIILALADGETALKTIIDMYNAGFITPKDIAERRNKNV